MPGDDAVAATFLAFSVRRLNESAKDIDRCVELLTEAQMWQRGGEHENSVANLLLHLEGNLRQWVLHGIAGEPDVRRRDDEFAASAGEITTIRARLARTVTEASATIAELPVGRLLEVIDPQPNGTWRNLPVLEAIYQVVAHFQQHMAQIVLLTKQMTARDLDLTMPRLRCPPRGGTWHVKAME